ncbi:MAG TPA: hypothetical protein VLA41_10845, partial [Burkholderiales bacterium]|nr:hypothetical protein [Burkholderiales bacterium]
DLATGLGPTRGARLARGVLDWNARAGERIRFDSPQIRVTAGSHPAATVASAAGLRVRARRLAEQARREALGERQLAYAFGTLNEDGMRQPVYPAAQ